MTILTYPKPAKPGRKPIALPLPTHKLINRVAALRGMSMSDTLYAVFRDELRRQEIGDDWALAPEPFSVKPTFEEGQCLVLVWNPFLPTLKLNTAEANALAEAIRIAADGASPVFRLVTSHDSHRVTLSRGGFHVSLNVDGDSFPMIRPAATDLADAIVSASVHAATTTTDRLI